MSVTVRLLVIALLAHAGTAAAQRVKTPPSSQIVVSPTTLLFTMTPGSGTSAAQSLAITNGGGGTLSGLTRNITYTSPRVGTDGIDVNWLQTTWRNMVTTAPTALDVIAHATATLPPGTYRAQVGIRSKTATNSPQVVEVILMVGSPAHLTMTPTVHDFGSVGVGGASAAQAFTITNDGGLPSGPLTAASGGIGSGAAVGGANPGDFRPDPNSSCFTASGGLAPQASCDIVFWFSPTGTGSRSAGLALGASPGGNVGAALSGTGTTAQVILVTPPSHDFGTFGAGLPATTQRFVLTNPLPWPTGPLQPLQSPGLPPAPLMGGPNPGDFYVDPNSSCFQVLSTGLPVSGSCYFDVTFLPTGLGARSAVLAFQMTPGGVVQIAFSGNSLATGFLTITPTTKDFGSVGIGGASAAQAFTITNNAPIPSGPLTASSGSFGTVLGGLNPGDFRPDPTSSCAGAAGGLAPHTSCDFVFWFSPTATGVRSAGLSLSASPGGTVIAALSGTGTTAQVIIVTPPARDFGDVGVGLSSPVQRFVLTNPLPWPTGPFQPLGGLGGLGGMVAGPNPGDFYFDQNSSCAQFFTTGLPVGGSCYFDVTFIPLGLGPRSATLVFQMTPGGVVQIPFSGNGVAAQLFTFSPASLDFGTVDVGTTSAPQRVRFTYTGVIPSGPIGPAAPGGGDFNAVLLPGCALATTGSFAPGAICDFDISFAPQTDGVQTASLTFTANPGGTAALQLSGTGIFSIPLPVLALAPTALDFGMVPIANTSPLRPFTVTNVGQAPVVLQSFALAGANATGFGLDPNGNPCLGVTLAPQQGCTFGVEFSPAVIGPRSATLMVKDFAGDQANASVVAVGTDQPVLQITPGSLDFGSVVLGRVGAVMVFTVTNTAGARSIPLETFSLTGTAATEYVVDPGSCNLASLDPGGACTLSVRFAPNTLGARPATLSVSGGHDPSGAWKGSAALTGTGVPAVVNISVAPTSHDFGAVVVGVPGQPATFTVTNNGTTKLILDPIALTGLNAAEFAVDPSDVSCANTINPGATCTFVVGFTPQALGPRSATVTVSSGPGTPGVSATLSGTGVFRLAISPATHDFGDVVVGQRSAVQWFTVTNQGAADVSLSGMRLMAGGYGLDINSSCINVVTVIASGGSCMIGVFFFPQVTGDIPGTLLVTTFAYDSATATLAGAGTLLPLSITPTAHDFGNVALGMTSNPATFIVSKHANGITLFAGAALSGPGAADYILDPGTCIDDLISLIGGCQISVSFGPQVAGPRPATLTVTIRQTDGTEYHATATLTGSGVSALVIAPSSHDFGSVIVGVPAPAVTFTVTNTGNTKVFHNLGLTGPHAADFAIDAGSITCAAFLNPGASCTFSVGFTPQAAGLRSATVSVAPGAGGSATLTGTGVDKVVTLTVAPTSHDFGALLVGIPGQPATFTVTNTGNWQVFVNHIDITGPDAADFAVDLSNLSCATFLAPGASCTFTIGFTPRAAGPRSATVTASGGGAAAAATLTGTGVAQSVVLTVAPASHDYGSVNVGQSSPTRDFTVTNTGNWQVFVNHFDITGLDAADFAVDLNNLSCATFLGPGASCTFSVFFKPQAAGVRSATVTASGGGAAASATLTGTGVDATGILVLTISPALYQFGAVLLGRTAGPATFTLTNPTSVRTGTINSFVLTGTGIADYSVNQDACAGAALDPGASCDFSVTFTPQVLGGHPVTLTVMSTTGEAGATELRGFGIAPAVLTITPNPHDFGFVFPGQTSAPVTFTVTNTGAGISGVINWFNITFSGPDASNFSFLDTSTCFGPIQLAPGASCNIDVFFFPQAVGLRSATLTVAGNGAGEGTGTATLTGGRTPASALTITPTSQDFGSIPLGLYTLPTTFTVTNVGTTPAIIGVVEIQDPLGTNYVIEQGSLCLGPFLDPGASCEILVHFEPQRTGPLPATLVVHYDLGTVSANLTGTGGASLTLTPGVLDFGTRAVGTVVGGVGLITVVNAGSTTTAPIDHIGFTGATPADFSNNGDGCTGMSLAPGASCIVWIQFIPQATGPRSATLTVQSSADGSSGSAQITGTGIPPAVLTVSPPSKDFGSVVVGQSSPQVTFTMANSGSFPAGLYVTSSFSGPGSADYEFHPFMCGSMTVTPGTTCQFWMWFKPRTLGPRPATLTITFQGGSVSVSLDGTGIPLSISASSAAKEVLGVPSLSNAERAFLDLLGNHDGVYDLGDLLAFLDRNNLKVSPARLGGAARRTENIP